MTPPRGKLKALACHPTKKVIKTEELNYLYTNIDSVEFFALPENVALGFQIVVAKIRTH
jgi:hypothetical protein